MDRIIIYIYEARQAHPSELHELQEKIRILSERRGVRVPSLYITIWLFQEVLSLEKILTILGSFFHKDYQAF